mgnify:FL=1
MHHVLVIGGAGYIGSHMLLALQQKGIQVTVLDNLSNGHAEAVLYGDLVVGDVADTALLDQIFTQNTIDAVLHFASFIQVGESVTDPAKYYANNVSNTIGLLNAMQRHGVKNLVFSSTAATFGEPQYNPIDERHPQHPINPYGRSKWMVEQLLQDYEHAYGLHSVCLRYFNAAGAHPEGLVGERHEPETHLIPLILQAASGKRSHITVFGRDYDTPDGTCIRDYIHVMDLVQAHVQALEFLDKEHTSANFNLGNGEGFSVQQVLDVARAVTGKDFVVQEGARRAGDPARLVASSALARKVLGWQPQYPDLRTIVEHAWAWECKTLAT